MKYIKRKDKIDMIYFKDGSFLLLTKGFYMRWIAIFAVAFLLGFSVWNVNFNTTLRDVTVIDKYIDYVGEDAVKVGFIKTENGEYQVGFWRGSLSVYKELQVGKSYTVELNSNAQIVNVK